MSRLGAELSGRGARLSLFRGVLGPHVPGILPVLPSLSVLSARQWERNTFPAEKPVIEPLARAGFGKSLTLDSESLGLRPDR